MKNPTLILCSDIHLREDTPICRTDNFLKTQEQKLNFLRRLQRAYISLPMILHAGDLFYHWKPSPNLLSFALQNLPDKIYTVYGQHDLPQHNIELAYKCGVDTLLNAEKISLLHECHFGQTPKNGSLLVPHTIKDRNILVWHKFCWRGKTPWPGCTDPTAKELLKKYPQYDLILTGDNHVTFVEEYKGRLLINPGSFTRQKSDQKDHKPCVFLWYAEDNSYEQVFLPIEENVVTSAHIEKREEREKRVDAFIEQLIEKWETDVNFRTNMRRFLTANNVKKSIVDIIWEVLERNE